MLYDAAFPKPNIECPHNISVEIEPGQATAFLTFPQPTTDVDWFRSVYSRGMGSCESLGSIKSREFLDQHSDYQLLRNSIPWC
jgi:hypothetical protein